MLFSPGTIVATRGAMNSINNKEIQVALNRHLSGDWGEVCEEDKELNNESLNQEGRLLSAYTSESGIKFWIITEWDRSVTTILLPEEY